ncbi:TonB family protein [Gilliamella sp. B2911]|uniref:TonB family protein n=1 Tax=Gilliamella sp. B2911 TaxID=2817980 RepID=UPI00226981D5|nr:TonB family protein [Gilliamella sp. B2911]MCX8663276.1 TonB family protein [Gilliamella sp. B2911]
MKINFDIDINNEKEPQSPASNKQKDAYIYTSISVISHLFLFGLLFSSALFANNIVVDEGDNSIKAVMIDLTQLAAPEQSLVEETPEIKGAENSEIIDNKPIEEPVVEPEVVEEKIPEPTPEIEQKKPATEPDKPVIVKPKPNKKKPPTQKSSRQQVRQDVISDNIANTSVAPKVSDNRQYSSNPSPISRNRPEYPRRALDMRLEGYVVAMFDVTSEGRVENIRIIEAQPNNIFNRSVISAMKMWKYKPIAGKDLKIKIVFNRDSSISLGSN